MGKDSTSLRTLSASRLSVAGVCLPHPFNNEIESDDRPDSVQAAPLKSAPSRPNRAKPEMMLHHNSSKLIAFHCAQGHSRSSQHPHNLSTELFFLQGTQTLILASDVLETNTHQYKKNCGWSLVSGLERAPVFQNFHHGFTAVLCS
jgi:hypothetical protein